MLHIVIVGNVKGLRGTAGVIIEAAAVKRAEHLHQRLEIPAVGALFLGAHTLQIHNDLGLVKELARAIEQEAGAAFIVCGDLLVRRQHIRAVAVRQTHIGGVAVFIHAAGGVIHNNGFFILVLSAVYMVAPKAGIIDCV